MELRDGIVKLLKGYFNCAEIEGCPDTGCDECRKEWVRVEADKILTLARSEVEKAIEKVPEHRIPRIGNMITLPECRPVKMSELVLLEKPMVKQSISEVFK